jgi:hypothetical protein
MQRKSSTIWAKAFGLTTSHRFEGARLAESSRASARLLNLGGGNGSNSQRTDLELEIASHLAEANSIRNTPHPRHLIPGRPASKDPDLQAATAMVEKVYLTSLPWIRQQPVTMPDLETADGGPEMMKSVVDAVEASAAMLEGASGPNVAQDTITLDDSPWERDSILDAGRSFERFEQLVAAVRELQVVFLAPNRDQAHPNAIRSVRRPLRLSAGHLLTNDYLVHDRSSWTSTRGIP